MKSAEPAVPNNGAPVGDMAPATQKVYTQGISKLGFIVLGVLTAGSGVPISTVTPLLVP